MSHSAAPSERRRLLVAGALAFAALGAIQAMYGPAFPGLVERFDVGIGTVGLVVSSHFAGSFLGIASSGFWLGRFGYRRVMVAGGAAMAAGALVVAFAPAWPVVLAGATLAGVGFGLSDIAFNLLPTRVFVPNAAPVLNGLNAVFGLGAVLGPLAVGAAGSTLRIPFVGVALLTVAATVLAARLPEPERLGTPGRVAVPWLVAGGFVLMYFLYVSVEVGVASWETVHLEPTLGAREAAFATGAYWGALTVGRLLAIPASRALRPRTLVLGAAVLGSVALAAAHALPLAPFAYALAGLAFAPVFPTGLAWLGRVFPHRSEQIAPMVVAAANLGPVVTAGAIGVAVARYGHEIVPTALLGIEAVMLIVVAALWRITRAA